MYTSMFRKAMLGDTATLNLDFTTGVLDSRLTFTRAANTATYINSSGYVTTATANTPRFDYDPVTLSPRGLLIEGENKNYFLYSSLLSNATWQAGTGGANDVTMTYPAVGITDPSNGSSAGFLSKPNTSSGYGFFRQTSMNTGTVSGNRTVSCWFKQPTSNAARYVGIRCTGNGFAPANLEFCATFDLQNGVVVANAGTNHYTNVSITAYPNGWYKCSATSGSMGTAFTAIGSVAIVEGVNGNEFNVIQGGTYIWGLQIELGSGASSYIPTGASQVTRNADDCTATGSNFSSWWPLSQSAFTVYWDGDITRSPANTQFYWLTRAGGSSRSRGYVTTGSLIRANSTVYDFTMSPTTSMTVGTRFRSAVAISSGSSAMYANNSTVTGSDTSASAVTLFDADSLNFNPNADNFMHIRAFKFYNSRLTNAELLALVS